MQKTVLFGVNTQLKQLNTDLLENHFCRNCQRLQKQLDYLHEYLSQKSQRNLDQGLTQLQESQSTKLLQIQLQGLKEKYLTLRKKTKLIETENQKLFQENSNLEKELDKCRQKLRQFESQKSSNQRQNEQNVRQKSSQPIFHSNDCKKLQLQVFIWQQKTQKLQNLMKSQTEEINRLKQLLKIRKRLQQQRHKLLQVFI